MKTYNKKLLCKKSPQSDDITQNGIIIKNPNSPIWEVIDGKLKNINIGDNVIASKWQTVKVNNIDLVIINEDDILVLLEINDGEQKK